MVREPLGHSAAGGPRFNFEPHTVALATVQVGVTHKERTLACILSRDDLNLPSPSPLSSVPPWVPPRVSVGLVGLGSGVRAPLGVRGGLEVLDVTSYFEKLFGGAGHLTEGPEPSTEIGVL